MMTRTQKIRLGIFLLAGTALVGGGIALLAGMSILRRYDYYTINFRETVSGLNPGSPVKVRGVDVGRVENITIDPKDVEVVNVRIRVRQGLPILRGALARLVTGGITGLKHVEITGGDKESGRIKPGSEIQSAPSQLTMITGKAEDIAIKAEQLLNNALDMTTPENRDTMLALVNDTRTMMQEVGKSAAGIRELAEALQPQLVGSLNELRLAAREMRGVAASLQDFVGATQGQMQATLTETRGAIRNIGEITGKRGQLERTLSSVRRTARSAGKRIDGPDVEKSLASLQNSMKAMQLLMIDVRALVNKASVDIRPVLRSARNAAEHIEEFARTARENPGVFLRPASGRERKLPRRE